ncbi:MAG: cation-transporting P-type ATPase [Chromatiaceae bacterium]
MTLGAPVVPLDDGTPGRARFRVLGLYRQEQRCRSVERGLCARSGIRSARANPLTASILVRFDPALDSLRLQQAIETLLAQHGVRLGANRAEKSPTEAGEPEDRRPPDEAQKSDRSSRKPVAGTRPQRETTAWHALGVTEVVARLQSSADAGLAPDIARARLRTHGPNALAQTEGRSDIAIFLGQLVSLPVGLLGISAAISVATGGLLDAAAIAAVVLINAVVGFATERQAERTISALGRPPRRKATLIRGGKETTVPVEDIVPGDLLILSPGAYVAADARLVSAHRLTLDESPLTGESMPLVKDAKVQLPPETPLADRDNMVFMGASVTGGWGRGLVTATGVATQMGEVHTLIEGTQTPDTPMERQLDDMGRQLALISGGICVGVFGLGLLRGYGWLPMLKAATSLAVAAVPEGLPAVATTTLALGLRHMRRQHVLIRQLDAVETLGAVQVFCLDKTGTLTLNRMTVVALCAGDRQIRVRDGKLFRADAPLVPAEHPEVQRLLEIVALCSETEVEDGPDGPVLKGSPTENALVRAALDGGIDVQSLRRERPRAQLQYRTEDRHFMRTFHQMGEGRTLLAVKGSPEQVLAMCTNVMIDGEIRPLDDGHRATVFAANARLAGEALRVLGVAFVESGEGEKVRKKHLVWLGLIGMRDPLRRDMPRLMRDFHDAGIETVLVTGDQSATAYAVARELNLARDGNLEILDSDSLEQLDPEILAGVVDKVDVFARVSPGHKLRIVQAQQRGQRVVAMTGDGVNDSPALKAADIGVAMGGSGTDVARSVADVVLEDDNLHTMLEAVRQGRTIYGNIRKTLRFLLSTNLSEIEVMVAAVGLGLGEPLTPMQLLWINLISDIFPGLALAAEPPESDVMKQPPRDPREPILRREDLWQTSRESLIITAGALGSYLYALSRCGAGPQASSQAFMTLSSAQLLHAFACRSGRTSIFDRSGRPPNPYLSGAVGISLVVQILAALVPGLRTLLGITPFTAPDALVMCAGSVAPLLVNELLKTATRRSGEERLTAFEAGETA